MERLLRGRPDGIFLNPFETGAFVPISSVLPAVPAWRALFRSGVILLTKGRSKDWLKVKNRSHPAIAGVKEAFA